MPLDGLPDGRGDEECPPQESTLLWMLRCTPQRCFKTRIAALRTHASFAGCGYSSGVKPSPGRRPAGSLPRIVPHNGAPTSRLTAVWEDRGMQLPDNASPGAGAGPLENLQTGATAVPRVADDDCPRRSLSQGLKRRQSCRQAAQPSLPPSCRDPKARQR